VTPSWLGPAWRRCHVSKCSLEFCEGSRAWFIGAEGQCGAECVKRCGEGICDRAPDTTEPEFRKTDGLRRGLAMLP
jgi:hypothetical protein